MANALALFLVRAIRYADADARTVYDEDGNPVGYLDHEGNLHPFAHVVTEHDPNGSTTDYADADNGSQTAAHWGFS